MPNMDPKKCPMPSQEPNVRNKNFKEVALGYTEEMAINEAKRCLQCKNHPCRSGCPVEIDIPGFIKHVAEGDFEAAYNVIAQSSALPAVCGRVCPQEHQCEGKCVRGIKGESVGIGRLERFVADWYRNNVHTKPVAPAPNGHKVDYDELMSRNSVYRDREAEERKTHICRIQKMGEELIK